VIADGIVTGVDRDSVAAPTTDYLIGESTIRSDDGMARVSKLVGVPMCVGIAAEDLFRA
jgi:hypothetical protein